MNDEIKKALDILRAGGIILYPTDTVWSIGCDATNEEAVKRIYELKKCSDNESMSVLVDNAGKIQSYVEEMPDMAWELIEMSEKPLTIIYLNVKNLAKNLIAEDGSVGIRVTNEVFSKTLCERFRKPIVFTSANVSDEKFPKSFTEISEEIINGVDYVVDFRRNDKTKAKSASIIKLGKGNVITVISL